MHLMPNPLGDSHSPGFSEDGKKGVVRTAGESTRVCPCDYKNVGGMKKYYELWDEMMMEGKEGRREGRERRNVEE